MVVRESSISEKRGNVQCLESNPPRSESSFASSGFSIEMVPNSYDGDGIFRARVRRILWQHVRDSLDDNHDQSYETNRLPNSGFNLSSEEIEVWEVSKLLGFSFEGDKEAIVKRICELERELRNNCCVSSSSGSSRGLLCLWDPDVFKVSENFVSSRYIALIGFFLPKNCVYGLVNVYGPSIEAEKSTFATELLEFLKSRQIP
ncbi:hypothetical protein V6N13_034311 [Hibiscus sabdariffa]|uniref:Uncharacterized protein n=1 Tax=Hibiscus sabdariffa TaxID=183260 RepID=A0ABR2F7V0_9ROSI